MQQLGDAQVDRSGLLMFPQISQTPRIPYSIDGSGVQSDDIVESSSSLQISESVHFKA